MKLLVSIYLASVLLLVGCATQTTPGQPDSVPTTSKSPLTSTEAASADTPLSRRDIVGIGLENTVTIIGYNSSGEEIGQGSGFFMQEGKVATNAHVVAGADWVEIYDLQQRQLASAPYALMIDIENDLAILTTPQFNRTGLQLADDSIQVGDDVWVFGAPLGLEGTTSKGIVSAFREREGMSLIQITAPISSGSSGGPILDRQGKLIGITTMMLTGGQNLNFAVPAEKLFIQEYSESSRMPFPPATVYGDASADQEMVELADQLLSSATIQVGSQYSGTLDEDSYTFGGSPFQIFQFEGYAGQELHIEATSLEIDTILELTMHTSLLSDDAWTVSDDDGGEGTNSLITTTLPETDIYYIFVSSYDDHYGDYRLAIEDAPVNNVQTLSVGERYQGVFDESTRSTDGDVITVYKLSGKAGQALQVDVTSRQVDPVVYLIRETGIDSDQFWAIEDDDGGDGTDAKIVAILPDTDTYYLTVESYDGSFGEYSINVQEVSIAQQAGLDDRWSYITETTSGDNVFFLDTQSLRRSSRDNGVSYPYHPDITSWIRNNSDGVQYTESGERYNYVVSLYEFDCLELQYRITIQSYYFQGERVEGYDIPYDLQQWSTVHPTSVGEAMLEKACTYRIGG